MLIDSGHEFYVFFSAFICGQLIFVIFDIFRALRKNVTSSIYVVSIQDIIFCILSFGIVYKTLKYVNNGEIRWFEPAALVFSAIIYFLFESIYVIKFFSAVFKLIIKPLKFILKWLNRALNIVKNIFFRLYIGNKKRFSEYSIKKLLKWQKNKYDFV